MSMGKKAQVSLFILFGLIVIISVLFLEYVNFNETGEINEEMPASPVSVTAAVESCLKDTANEAVIEIGLQGGYYDLPPKSVDNFFSMVPYYFYDDHELMPSIETIETEISKYVGVYFEFCLSDLTEMFPEYKITYGTIKTYTTIAEQGIIVSAELPITLEQGDKTQELDKFSVSLDGIRLLQMYNAVNESMQEQLKEPSLICTSCLVDIGENYDLYFDLERLNETIVIFTVTDYNSTLNDEPYTFVYANKYIQYSCSSPPPDADPSFWVDCVEGRKDAINYTFSLAVIQDIEATVNRPFYYQVIASGYNLSFYDYTSIFDINKITGEIKFTPKADQKGNYTIWVEAVDGLGNSKMQDFILTVKNE